MIEKLKRPVKIGGTTFREKINELVDAVNELQEMCKSCDKQIGILAEQIAKLQHDNSEKANCQGNVQPDYVTTSYLTDGHTQEYYGQNGGSIVTDHPLPAGYIITIREPETKGGNNE